MKPPPFLPILALLLTPPLAAAPPAVLAIRNARIVPVSGAPIERGAVVVRNGLVESVGAALNIPADAYVLDGTNLTVYPGLINGRSTWGLPADPAPPAGAPRAPASPPSRLPSGAPRAVGPEDRPASSAWLRAQDLLRISDPAIAQARAAGFTSAVIFPVAGILAGHGAVINLGGETLGQMVVAPSAGLHISFATRGFTAFPGSLMGAIAYVRQVFLDAGQYRVAKAAYEKNARAAPRPAYDRTLEGVLGAQRLLLPANRLVEIDRMLRFAAELGVPAVLYGGQEAYRDPEKLAKAGAQLLVDLHWPERAEDADPGENESLRVLDFRRLAPSTPAALAKAGVRFAFYSGEKTQDMRKAVRAAMTAGLTPEQALRAFTLSAAEIYNIADRLGSIEPGKIANLVVADGDLFASATQVKYLLIDGVKHELLPEPPQKEMRP